MSHKVDSVAICAGDPNKMPERFHCHKLHKIDKVVPSAEILSDCVNGLKKVNPNSEVLKDY